MVVNLNSARKLLNYKVLIFCAKLNFAERFISEAKHWREFRQLKVTSKRNEVETHSANEFACWETGKIICLLNRSFGVKNIKVCVSFEHLYLQIWMKDHWVHFLVCCCVLLIQELTWILSIKESDFSLSFFQKLFPHFSGVLCGGKRTWNSCFVGCRGHGCHDSAGPSERHHLRVSILQLFQHQATSRGPTCCCRWVNSRVGSQEEAGTNFAFLRINRWVVVWYKIAL